MRRLAVLTLATAAAAFATPALAQDQAPVSDPAEGFNRAMYGVNDALDRAILEPAAKGYRAVTPSFARAGVRNFLRNLRGPVIFVNDVLQVEPTRAGTTATRFVINSTLGVVGLFDVAGAMGLERHDEDFGQTLGVWGVGPGPYFYLPLMGPTNLRDGFGRVVDTAFNPLTWAEFDNEEEFTATRIVFGALSTREELIETIDDLRATSTDPYVTVRSTYSITRESAIRNGLQDVQDLPDFNETYDSPDVSAPLEAPGTAAPMATVPEPGAAAEGAQGVPQ